MQLKCSTPYELLCTLSVKDALLGPAPEAALRGNHVYVVLDACDAPLYVGHTKQTIRSRLRSHRAQSSSLLGQFMQWAGKRIWGWTVEIYRVDGRASAVERAMIVALNPTFNLYHSPQYRAWVRAGRPEAWPA
jgi:hypothetical protein